MTVLVTGGTGFIGGAIVQALVKQGQQVRVLARRTSRTEHLTSLGVEIAYGDILDEASIEAALQAVDTLYHAAALYEFWVPDKEAMMKTEIDGTTNALNAALKANVEKVIYTSAAVAIGEPKGEVGNETTKHRGYFLSTYERAKYEAEQVARSYMEKGLPVIIIQPAAVIGPGDLKPTGQGIINVLNGRAPIVFEGASSFVYIDDIGKAHVLAADKGQIGEAYLISERIISMTDFFSMVCGLAGVKTPRVGPLFVSSFFANLGELVSRFTKKRPQLPKDNLKTLSHGFRIDGSKAVRDLGIQYTPLEEGMRRAIAWYWEQGLLKHEPAFIRGN